MEPNTTPDAQPNAPKPTPEMSSNMPSAASSVSSALSQNDTPTPLELTPAESLLSSGDEGLIGEAEELIESPAPEPVISETMTASSAISEVLATSDAGGSEMSEKPVSEAEEHEEVVPKIGTYEPTEVVRTVPVFTPHPAHSALRTVIMTLIVLLVLAGGGLAYLQRDNLLQWVDSLRDKYASSLPAIPESGTTHNDGTSYDFSSVPTFALADLGTAAKFPPYVENYVPVTPNVPPYKISTGLKNVVNKEHFTYYAPLDVADESLLKTNGFMVRASGQNEFFSLYETNRYNHVPSFITTDSILHNYHLLFDHLLKRLEQDKLAFVLHQLNERVLAQASDILDDAEDTPWESAAKRNLGFFAVGSKLLDPQIAVPKSVTAEVSQELDLIKKMEGIAPSPVINQGSEEDQLLEDYTQYKPRGHYDGDQLLEQYFRSMMWYGRLSFRFKNEDEIRSAILATLILRDAENQALWSTLSDPIDFFVGKGDDIGFREMNGLLEEVYGTDVDLKTVIDTPEKLSIAVEKTRLLKSPEINSMPIFDPSIMPDRDAEIKSFRFFGQRFTLDASIFQRLVFREVGTREKPRMLPKGLDIPAAFGSAEALSILTKTGETAYEKYPENMKKVQTYVQTLSPETWTQNLYWGWLYTLRTLTGGDMKGYPMFMQNQAWTRKNLNTFLASWAELKHDTILYAKQVYAELGGGGEEEPTPPDDRGYVEPNAALYARLSGLLQMTQSGLDAKKLLSHEMRDVLSKMEALTSSLQTISEKELKNEKLSDTEYELIRSYGGQLEHFWMEVNREAMAKQNLDQRNFLDQNPAAIIADVATDPKGQVLEVGTGKVFEIYVIVPVDGVLKLLRGGVSSYYEFPWPMDDRLTDKKWRAMMGITSEPEIPALAEDKKPAQPAWTHTFMED